MPLGEEEAKGRGLKCKVTSKKQKAWLSAPNRAQLERRPVPQIGQDRGFKGMQGRDPGGASERDQHSPDRADFQGTECRYLDPAFDAGDSAIY